MTHPPPKRYKQTTLTDYISAVSSKKKPTDTCHLGLPSTHGAVSVSVTATPTVTVAERHTHTLTEIESQSDAHARNLAYCCETFNIEETDSEQERLKAIVGLKESFITGRQNMNPYDNDGEKLIDKDFDRSDSQARQAHVSPDLFHIADADVTETALSAAGENFLVNNEHCEAISPEMSSSEKRSRIAESCPKETLPVLPRSDAERIAFQGHARHMVFVKTPTVPGLVPEPSTILCGGHVGGGHAHLDRWDEHHVRMPCSPQSLYPLEGSGLLEPRWDLVKHALLQPMATTYDIEDAILTYNSRYKGRWSFRNLHQLFSDAMTAEESAQFFSNTLPAMVRLAVSLPVLIPNAIPLLKQQQNMSLTFSQQQVASLLANGFFCTFPRRNALHKGSEFSTYPTINMNDLFQSNRTVRRNSAIQNKLRCLIHYFTKVCAKVPTGCVTFKRRVIDGLSSKDWVSSLARLPMVHFTSSGLIEDAEGMLQVDFANMRIGGGVLHTGCVQEEIQFVIHPELIVSRLFTETLADNEVMVIKGVERHSKYAGYGDTFRFTGDFKDEAPYDGLGRRYRRIVAMDATRFGNDKGQFEERALLREINKARCGFYSKRSMPIAVATGNWGCGAFKGNHRLKALIQLMAAADRNRAVYYSAFGDARLSQELCSFYNFAKSEDLSVGTLWRLLLSYSAEAASSRSQGSLKGDHTATNTAANTTTNTAANVLDFVRSSLSNKG